MNQHEHEYRYLGGMRVIECLRDGEDIGPVLNDLFQRRRDYGGAAVFNGAVESLLNQYFAFRSKGYTFSSKDRAVDLFLQRRPASMSLELTRLIDGGNSTFNELALVLTSLTNAVWSQRKLLTFGCANHASAPC
jgi:hypothetical protein